MVVVFFLNVHLLILLTILVYVQVLGYLITLMKGVFTSYTCLVLAFLLFFINCHAAVQTIVVYDDALNGFEDWSWSTHSLTNTNPVHSGTYSISHVNDNWAGLYFHGSTPYTATGEKSLVFWVNGGTQGGQTCTVSLRRDSGASTVVSANVGDILTGYSSIPANTWAKATLTALGPGAFNEIWFMAGADNDGTMYFDDISIVISGSPQVGLWYCDKLISSLLNRATPPAARPW